MVFNLVSSNGGKTGHIRYIPGCIINTNPKLIALNSCEWDFLTSANSGFYTSSTAQGGGGSFKNRKPIGEIGCCESGMAERSH